MAYRRTPAVQDRLDTARTRLLEAALSLVEEQGYTGCTMVDLATRAEVGVGTVYRYFPNKGQLVAEVFRAASGREMAAVTDATEQLPASACACQRLTVAVHTFASRALRAPTTAYALLAEPVDPAVDAERLVFRAAYRDLFAGVLAAGVSSGHLPRQDVTVTAAGLVGAIGESLVLPLTRGGAEPAAVAALIAFTRRAIGAPQDGAGCVP